MLMLMLMLMLLLQSRRCSLRVANGYSKPRKGSPRKAVCLGWIGSTTWRAYAINREFLCIFNIYVFTEPE